MLVNLPIITNQSKGKLKTIKVEKIILKLFFWVVQWQGYLAQDVCIIWRLLVMPKMVSQNAFLWEIKFPWSIVVAKYGRQSRNVICGQCGVSVIVGLLMGLNTYSCCQKVYAEMFLWMEEEVCYCQHSFLSFFLIDFIDSLNMSL